LKKYLHDKVAYLTITLETLMCSDFTKEAALAPHLLTPLRGARNLWTGLVNNWTSEPVPSFFWSVGNLNLTRTPTFCRQSGCSTSQQPKLNHYGISAREEVALVTGGYLKALAAPSGPISAAEGVHVGLLAAPACSLQTLAAEIIMNFGIRPWPAVIDHSINERGIKMHDELGPIDPHQQRRRQTS
jgi:hypothetical protein